MKFLLILTWFAAQSSYDGGVAVHTQRIEFGTMARCEAAQRAMVREAAQHAQWNRVTVRLSAVCLEAY